MLGGGGGRKGVMARRMRACVAILASINTHTRVKCQVHFAILILGAIIAGGNGGSRGAWRFLWVDPIRARAQVRTLAAI